MLDPAGHIAAQQRDLLVWSVILMLVIIIPVMALTIWFAWKYRQSNTANTFRLTDDDKASGYQWGGGFERKITPEVTLGLEYLYTQLEDDGFVVRAAGPAAATNPFLITNTNGTDFRRSEEDFEVHSVRLTAAYRF